jgi:hypothetical protein
VKLVAVNALHTAVDGNFIGTAKIEVLDASNSTGALDANKCRSTWTSLGLNATQAPDATFTAGVTASYSFTVPDVYKDLRLRITYPATGTALVIGCTTDNFAVRPAALGAVAAQDLNWTTAYTTGTARALDNSGTVHKAGQPFTIRRPRRRLGEPDVELHRLADHPSEHPSRSSAPAPAPAAPAGSLTFSAGWSSLGSGRGARDRRKIHRGRRALRAARGPRLGRGRPRRRQSGVGLEQRPADERHHRALRAEPFRHRGEFDAPVPDLRLGRRRVRGQRAEALVHLHRAELRLADGAEHYRHGEGSGRQHHRALSRLALHARRRGNHVYAQRQFGRRDIQCDAGHRERHFEQQRHGRRNRRRRRLLLYQAGDAAGRLYGIHQHDDGRQGHFQQWQRRRHHHRRGLGRAAGVLQQHRLRRRRLRRRPDRRQDLRLRARAAAERVRPEHERPAGHAQHEYYNGSTFATNAKDNCTSFASDKFKIDTSGSTLSSSTIGISISGTFVAGFANLRLGKPNPAPASAGSATLCLDLDATLGSGDTSCQGTAAGNKTFLQGAWNSGSNDKDPKSTIGFGIFGTQKNLIFFRENY